ncbi:MAG: hypothetical protein JNK98_01335 [Chitinophagaceae bacterium]|nr:hypothetical protein [Chitinophagaceae bacterium]
MRKSLALIVAIVYLSTTTGATIHMHYCMGKLADWGLGHNRSKTCGNCGMEKSEEKDNGCCKDEQKFVKNDNDQKTAEALVITFASQVIDLPIEYFSVLDIPVSSVTEKHPVSHAPPRSNGVAVYIRNCSFLI